MTLYHRTRVCLLALILSSPAWTPTVQAQRPLGIDVSKWQPSINWSQVYGSGRVFAFIKATEGTGYTDPYLTTHTSGAKAAGLLVGVYHFARPDLGNSGTTEANWFVSAAGQYMTGGHLPPVLDLESTGGNLAAWSNDFCNRVYQLKGVRPLIYTNWSFANNYLDNTNTVWDLWYANPTNGDPQTGNPSVPRWSTWTFWQYSWTGSVPGISGNCDLNVFHGTMSDLLAYVIPGGTTPPHIAVHPASQTAAPGDTVTLTVAATGGTPLSYQWQKNQANLSNGGHYSGVLTSSLTISNCDSTDAASYRCVVTNPYGTATSNAATLSLGAQPTTYIVESRTGGQHFGNYSETGTWSDGTCKSSAAGCTAGIGSRWCTISSTPASAIYRFTPAAGGVWEVFTTNCNTSNSGNPLIHKVTHVGGTASVGVCQNSTCTTNAINNWYSLGQYTLDANIQYTVTLDGSTASGSSPSNNAGRSDAIKWVLISTPAPVISQHPQAASVCAGGTASFTVAAGGDGPLTYQWQKDQANIANGGHYSGTTTPVLTVSSANSSDAASYRCVVSNPWGSTLSNGATLTVRAITSITQQPSSVVTSPGTTASFAVTATGDGTLSYRWQKDGVDLADNAVYAGATTANLTVSNCTTNEVGTYRCLVTGNCGTVQSDPASLSLTQPGDFDDDADVDQEDFAIMQACLGTWSASADPVCGKADLNGDDMITNPDVTRFIGCMSGPQIAANPGCLSNP